MAKKKPAPKPAAKPKPKPKPKPKAPQRKPNKPPDNAPWMENAPTKPRPIDPRGIAAEGRNQSARDTDSVSEQLKDIYPQLARYQQGQIKYLADGLNNAYTRQAVGQVNQSFGAADQMGNLANQTVGIGDAAGANINALAPQVIGIGDQAMGQIGGLGTMLGDQARQGFATAGPTEIEAELYRQGQAELALGRSLSPEQMRDATQSARQGMAARGMATGNAALGAELLNRERFASQREAERRAFAGTANNLREQNVMSRRQAAGNMATASGNLFDAAGRIGMAGREVAGNLYDTAGRIGMTGRQLGGALLGDAGRLRQSGAGMLADLDPYARAINPGMALGQSATNMGLGVIGNNMSGNRELIGNAASFNMNQQGNLYRNWQDDYKEVHGGNLAADAARAASKRGPFDYVTGIIGSLTGRRQQG